MLAVSSIVLASSTSHAVWPYVLLFLGVMLSWSGVPAIGTASLGAAAVAASQGQIDITAVIIVATVAGEAGGLIGYAVGGRWGREILERSGKRQAKREHLLSQGELAYSKWGRLAVFFTPAIISGTAKMPYGQFIIWNFVASFLFSLSVGLSSYGLGRVASGDHSGFDIGALVIGLVATVVLVIRAGRRRRRTRAQAAGSA